MVSKHRSDLCPLLIVEGLVELLLVFSLGSHNSRVLDPLIHLLDKVSELRLEDRASKL